MSGDGGRVVRPAKRLRGALRVPGDKSISHRALLLGALAQRATLVRGLAPGADVQATRRCLAGLGVTIRDEGTDGESLTYVHGAGFDGLKAPERPLDCGASGTTIRLLAGVVAAADIAVTLAADASLSRRPMGRIAEPLRTMGARVEGAAGPAGKGITAPLTIVGTARPKAISFDMPVASAQVKSAILLAGLRAAGRTVVREPSRSRDHTERMLRVFGADVLEDGLAVTLEGPADLEGARVDVPGDVSSGAFFAAAAAALPGSRILLRELGVNPGRTGALEVLRAMGANVIVADERECGFEPVGEVFVEGPAKLAPTRIEGELVPRAIDELPLLAVVAARAEGVTEIRDAAELRVKESDRIATVASNLERMGGRCEALPDGLRIEGGRPLRGAEIDPAGDHRIAMAFAIAGLFAEGETRILDPGCVEKSYPGFFEDLEKLCER